MAGEWRASTWGDEISLEYGKALRGHDVAEGRYRVFGSNGPIGWSSKPLAPGPGVILGRKGAYRGVQYSREPFFVIDTAYYVVPKSELDMRWLYYAIEHYKLGEVDDGSPIPSTTRAAVYMLDLDVPPLPEQRAIAHILGTLDDKIELNRRMSETLEAMARALFKAWFVDFEPVRAKIEGRWQRGQSLPGLPVHFYDLFPDRFVDSDLGEIPEGWGVGCLGDVADHQRRGIQPNDIENGTPYIALEHMPKGRIALTEWGTADVLESNKFVFKQGEILFGKLRPYFHKVGVAPVDGVCSTDIVVLTATSSDWFGFVLGHVSSSEFVEYTNAGSTGTKMPRTSWNDMARYELVLPPKPVAKAFAELMQPSIDRITAGIHQSRTLATLRDTLLPKLISGELHVARDQHD
ncbi:restriction endonuclease subunit S [Metallibacterium scheffleri]|nr:restriction endonuclease subunit S [Metallibacterium scheffleri]